MDFVKMQGIGNDYVYVDAIGQKIDDPSALAIRVADRHFGIGGDGLILVAAPTDEGKKLGASVRMRMFNADGSESEMCGNGIRCVAKFAYDRGISRANPMKVETQRGVLTLDLWLERGKVAQVSVNMGTPILQPADIPVLLTGIDQVVNHPWERVLDLRQLSPNSDWIAASGLAGEFTCVSMGNPHIIFYCRNVHRIPLEAIGPKIETHPLFPKRINVHFVQVRKRAELIMRTWERGSGITLACGTGASAVCVAGVLTNRSDRLVKISLPGGELGLKWNQADGCVYMTGPAVEVFSGVWPDA
jgi:diaminopimelate epimerase